MTVLMIVAFGVLGYEIVYSELSFILKRFLFLDRQYPAITLLSSPKAWKKLFGKWMLFPPVLILAVTLIVLATVHQFVFKLIQCPYCTAFWTGFICSFLIFNSTTAIAFLIAFCSMGSCSVYNLIRNHVV